ncbi:LysR family transcriptional regulator [Sphingomonas sp.]|uniref:LysR family transcriptional regulator n=1 Tax=Sphingomonas sp. TaxID=28214 RepID=UPI002ED91342
MTPGPYSLNLRHLRALSAIVERGNMSAAAQAVNLSQPALTQGLAKLERQLGTILFDRRSDGVSATAAGLALAERATAAFAHLTTATRGAARRTGRGFALPEMLMTASQLQAFLALADAGSFAAAAVATGVSQPALHRAVRDLEQICGVAIAERRGRGVVLTAAGRRLARGVRLAAREIGAGIAELGSDQQAGRMAIGAMPLSRALLLPRAIAAFVGSTPRAVIDVAEGSWRELVEPLRDGIIDLMVGALRDEPPPGLEQRALFEDRLVIIARVGHPLAAIVEPTLDDFAEYGWVVGQVDTPLRAQWDTLFAGRPAPAAPIECGSVMVIRGVLRDTDLLTLLSPDQVALEVAGGLLTTIGRPLAHGVRTIGITTRIGWRPTAAQARFIALLEQFARPGPLSGSAG